MGFAVDRHRAATPFCLNLKFEAWLLHFRSFGFSRNANKLLGFQSQFSNWIIFPLDLKPWISRLFFAIDLGRMLRKMYFPMSRFSGVVYPETLLTRTPKSLLMKFGWG